MPAGGLPASRPDGCRQPMMVKDKLFATSAPGGRGNVVRGRRKRQRDAIRWRENSLNMHFDLLKAPKCVCTFARAVTQAGENSNAEIAVRGSHDYRGWVVCRVGNCAKPGAAS